MRIEVNGYELEIQARRIGIDPELSDDGAMMFLNSISADFAEASDAIEQVYADADMLRLAFVLCNKFKNIHEELNRRGYFDAYREDDSDDC